MPLRRVALWMESDSLINFNYKKSIKESILMREVFHVRLRIFRPRTLRPLLGILVMTMGPRIAWNGVIEHDNCEWLIGIHMYKRVATSLRKGFLLHRLGSRLWTTFYRGPASLGRLGMARQRLKQNRLQLPNLDVAVSSS